MVTWKTRCCTPSARCLGLVDTRIAMVRRLHPEDASSSSSPSAHPDDEEDFRAEFLADFDEQAFLRQLDAFQTSLQSMPPIASTVPPAPVAQPASTPSVQAAPASSHSAPAMAPNIPAENSSSEFYGTAIQILTHILGSSTPYPWLSDVGVPKADDSARNMASNDHMRQLINVLVERLGGSSTHRVKEQDLTHILQTLLAQQQQPPTQQSMYLPPTSAHFADLAFPDEEDDDPDFLPLSSERDELTAAPSATAWTRAMDEVVPTETSKPRRGRPRRYTTEEAAERKRDRNRDYMARQRTTKKQRVPYTPETSATAASIDAPGDVSDRLVLEAENRFLRAELERLREENAKLRGREEMRAYAAQLGINHREQNFRP